MESTYHYLFKCPKYTRQRNSLFRNLFQLLNIQPSEDLLLFGSPDLDINSNISFYDSA
jgi:predicted AAA+ superfamily ATPase